MKIFPNEKIMHERESFFSPGSTLDITSDHRKNQSRASLTATPNVTLHRCVTLCHFEDLYCFNNRIFLPGLITQALEHPPLANVLLT